MRVGKHSSERSSGTGAEACWFWGTDGQVIVDSTHLWIAREWVEPPAGVAIPAPRRASLSGIAGIRVFRGPDGVSRGTASVRVQVLADGAEADDPRSAMAGDAVSFEVEEFGRFAEWARDYGYATESWGVALPGAAPTARGPAEQAAAPTRRSPTEAQPPAHVTTREARRGRPAAPTTPVPSHAGAGSLPTNAIAGDKLRVFLDVEGFRTMALFDPASYGMRITKGELRGRTFPNPSAAAAAIIERIAPGTPAPEDAWALWRLHDTSMAPLADRVRTR